MADEMTPEEKLLKVIQQGGAPVAATAAPSPEPTPAVPLDHIALPVSSGTAALGIGLLRRVLIAATVALLVLVCIELYRHLPPPAEPPAPLESPLVVVEAAEATIPIADVAEHYDRRRITGIAGEEAQLRGVVAAVVPWIAQLHEKYRFMALSEVEPSAATGGDPVIEAIVMDKFVKTIQFIRQGQTVQVGDYQVLVKAITESGIEFESGSDSMTLSAGSPTAP